MILGMGCSFVERFASRMVGVAAGGEVPACVGRVSGEGASALPGHEEET
jgi:hypothetical protein